MNSPASALHYLLNPVVPDISWEGGLAYRPSHEPGRPVVPSWSGISADLLPKVRQLINDVYLDHPFPHFAKWPLAAMTLFLIQQGND